MKLDAEKTALPTLDHDAGPEADVVLTEKIFSRPATVLTMDAFMAERGDN